MRERVVVAMSGGVDSSVAAALLCEQGYEVIGVAMRLVPEEFDSSAESSHKRCCSFDDFEDARRVAELMDFPFYVIDLRPQFRNYVINPFIHAYLNGRTPNPCVSCNQYIKFDELFIRARALEASYVATGHYARNVRDSRGRFHLRRACDLQKDQSYFLYMLKQEQLAHILFPLGELTKAEVRERARALGLVNADKPESQEICFVGARRYDEFVSSHVSPEEIKPGRIIDINGRVLGTHTGIHRFTVGQRRGLKVAAGVPLYVREIRADTGDVVVAPQESLRDSGVRVRQISLTGSMDEVPRSLEVKIRYRHPTIPATVEFCDDEHALVRFSTANPAVTPGQACVFYLGDEVIGGGIIESAL